MSLVLSILNNGQLVGDLDLYDVTDFPFALTMEVADIKDVLSRGGVVSKTFKIPATKNNNTLLSYFYNISVEDTAPFNISVVVSYNGAQVQEGQLQVRGVGLTDNPQEYELIFYANNNDWAQALTDIKITELEFNNPSATDPKQGSDATGNWNVPASTNGVFTHDQAHMETSWFGTYDTGWDYVYSLKSFGQPTGFRSGGAYVRPDDMRADVYMRSMIREMFNTIGWNVDSDFFDSADFKQMVYPAVGEFLHKALTSSSASLPSPFSFTGFPGSPSAVQSIFIPGFTDRGVTYPNFTNASGTDQTEFVNGIWPITRDTNVTGSASATVENPNLNLFQAQLRIRHLNESGALIADAAQTISFNGAASVNLSVNYDFDCEDGDNIEFRIVVNSVTNIPLVYNVTVATISIDYTKPQLVLVGESYDLAWTLQDITCYDFMVGLTQLFNIYYHADSGTKTVYAEPRQSFYTDYKSTSIDWTDKVNIENLGFKTNSKYKRELQFQFQEDGADGWMAAANDKLKRPLGSFWYKMNDLLDRGTEKLENKIFAYTDNFYDTLISEADTVGVRVPRFWASDEDYPDQEFTFEPRALYYDGHVSQGVGWYWTSPTNLVSNVPYSRTDGDFSLSYDITDGLVERYYLQTIGTIINNKVLYTEVYLTPTDINTIDFRTPIFLDINNVRGYYYLNKVIDFQPTSGATLTKVELVPVVPFFSLTQANIIVGDSVSAAGHKVGAFRRQGYVAGSVLKNGTGNQALNESFAAGVNLSALGEQQSILGKYNVADTSDIFQVGAGSANERYRGLTFNGVGEFHVQGGNIYTTDGLRLLYAKERDADDNPTNVQEVYLLGNT